MTDKEKREEHPKPSNFEMALAEMIMKTRMTIEEPWVVAAQWKDELVRLARDEEPESEEFDKFEYKYFNDNDDDIISVYDRHAGLVDGARWQKQQMMKDAVDGVCMSNGSECGSSIESSAGMLFLQRNTFDVGDKVKIIIVKED